jgi:hypothetical protein
MSMIFWKGKDREATPALLVIIKFGGLTGLADALGKRPSTVQRWMESGFIPPRYQGEILSIAAIQGVHLDPAIFVPAPEAERAA